MQRLTACCSNWSSFFLAVVIISILIAGLWPFNFFPTNQVRWLSDRDGVHFYGQGLISSNTPLFDQTSLSPDQPISLEIRVRPLLYKSSAPPVLTLFDGQQHPELLYIGQWKSHLGIWSRADNPANRKRGKLYQELSVHDALINGRDVLITIASGPKGTTIYVNGRAANFYRGRRLIASQALQPVHLILGNAPSGQSSWNGYFMGLAIYNRVLNKREAAKNYSLWMKNDWHSLQHKVGICVLYTFSEGKGSVVADQVVPGHYLTIPHLLTPLQRVILDPTWHDFRLDWSFISDIAVNILGFIPFGLAFSLFLSRKMRPSAWPLYVVVAVCGITLSLSIELAQIYLPSRYSQLSDVLFNTMGTLIGLLLFHLAASRMVTSIKDSHE